MRCGARCAVRGQQAADDHGVHAACRGARVCRLRAGHGDERTASISRMSVTLEVSKLSGWLNADAPLNMPYMFLTLEVSKLSVWLNAEAR